MRWLVGVVWVVLVACMWAPVPAHAQATPTGYVPVPSSLSSQVAFLCEGVTKGSEVIQPVSCRVVDGTDDLCRQQYGTGSTTATKVLVALAGDGVWGYSWGFYPPAGATYVFAHCGYVRTCVGELGGCWPRGSGEYTQFMHWYGVGSGPNLMDVDTDTLTGHAIMSDTAWSGVQIGHVAGGIWDMPGVGGGVAGAMSCYSGLGGDIQTCQLACDVGWVRNPPGTATPCPTPVATITPTIVFTGTPSCLPGAIGWPCTGTPTPWPCVGIICPPGGQYTTTPFASTPWAMTPFPSGTPWPTQLPATAQLQLGSPVSKGCHTIIPKVDFTAPIAVFGFLAEMHVPEYQLCLSEQTFSFKLYDWDIGYLIAAVVAASTLAVLYSILKRS